MRLTLQVILTFLLAAGAYGQDVEQPDLRQHSWDVFLKRDAAAPGRAELIFIDLLSGEESRLAATGDGFALTASGVVFFDRLARQVKLAKADGIIRDHPFIKATANTHRVDWAVSSDLRHIVWTLSRRVEDQGLITATWLADVAGGEIRELLVYGPRAGIQLLPVSFGAHSRQVYMEAYADGSEALSVYRRRAGLFSLTLDDGELVTAALPGDQACFCAVGFGAGSMLRLRANQERDGLDLEIYHIASGEGRVIPAIAPGDYHEGGNIVVSADGRRAVYALSQLDDPAGEPAEIRSVLVDVDIENGSQRVASPALRGLIRPLGFTDEKRTALLTTGEGYTLKLDLEDGRLVEVADAIYLGQIGDR